MCALMHIKLCIFTHVQICFSGCAILGNCGGKQTAANFHIRTTPKQG